MYGKVDLGSFRDGPVRRRYSKEALYAQSKLVSLISSDKGVSEMGTL